MDILDFRVLEFKEGKYFYNTNYNYTDEVKKDLQLSLEPELIYKEGSDVSYIRLIVVCRHNDTILMSYDMSLGFLVKDWSTRYLTKQEDELRKSDALLAMSDVFTGFFRGALAVRSKGSALEEIFFPLLSIEEFAGNLSFRKVKTNPET